MRVKKISILNEFNNELKDVKSDAVALEQRVTELEDANTPPE